MSTTSTTAPAGTGPTGTEPAVPTVAQSLSRWWRQAWIWFVLGALLLLVTLPSLFRQDTDTRQLSPESPAPNGARAVVQVLADRGISVHPADSLDDALALAREHPEAPVLFHDAAGYLPAAGLEELAAAITPDRRVLVEPDFQALRALVPAASQAGQVPDAGALDSGDACRIPMGREAETAAAAGRSYRVTDGEACFPVPGTGSGPTGPSHTVLETVDGTVVIGNHGVFANQSVDAEGHPVLSLWSLGRSSEVIWYLPGLDDVAIDPGPPATDQLLPDWVRPAGIWLIVCLGVLMLWRGRRHGPLAVEPLPVVVPGAETAVGRARLYERSGQHAAAARSLRSATLVRLSRMLRLGHGATVDAVVAAAARTTGHDPARVAAALDVTQVASTRDLVAAGRSLQDLEDAVHAALTAEAPPPNSTPGPRHDHRHDPRHDPDGRTP